MTSPDASPLSGEEIERLAQTMDKHLALAVTPYLATEYAAIARALRSLTAQRDEARNFAEKFRRTVVLHMARSVAAIGGSVQELPWESSASPSLLDRILGVASSEGSPPMSDQLKPDDPREGGVSADESRPSNAGHLVPAAPERAGGWNEEHMNLASQPPRSESAQEWDTLEAAMRDALTDKVDGVPTGWGLDWNDEYVVTPILGRIKPVILAALRSAPASPEPTMIKAVCQHCQRVTIVGMSDKLTLSGAPAVREGANDV